MKDTRIRKAWHIATLSCPEGIVVFAPNASKARAQVIAKIRDAWDCSFRDALCEVRGVTRAAGQDVALPPRHPLTPSIGPKVLHCVVHAYGGRGLKAGYRDHFYTGADDWVMRAALWHGLFRECRRDKGRYGQPDMIGYALTALGKNVAAGEVATYPECWQ